VTYRGAAEALGVGVGTIYRHLDRVRKRKPEVYRLLMAERYDQVADRYVEALARLRQRADRWRLKQRNRAYFRAAGRWPRERQSGRKIPG
jgi:AcrR family transcriptional regulator